MGVVHPSTYFCNNLEQVLFCVLPTSCNLMLLKMSIQVHSKEETATR